MTAAAFASALDLDVEALLWADRVREAEASGPWFVREADVLSHGDASLLAVVDEVSVFDSDRRERLLCEWERAVVESTRWQAEQVRLLGEALDLALSEGASGSAADLAVRSIAAELALAVGLSDRTVQQHLNDAVTLRDRFPATFRGLRAGRLSRAHALVVADEGCRLDDEAVRAEYERVVLERGAGLTTGRLRAMAKSLAEDLDPVPLAERHADARTKRRVSVRDVEDGMAELWALLPAVLAHGMYDRVTQLARTVQDAAAEDAGSARGATEVGATEVADFGLAVIEGATEAADVGLAVIEGATEAADVEGTVDERTLDQLRADVLCDLVLTGHSSTAGIDRDGGEGIDGIRAIVQITVPVQTLIGDEGPAATLAGRCPIDPESARRLAGGASLWNRVLTDPITGEVLAVDRRFPSEAQRRLLRARDEHCRFPGCRAPVWRCDVDHTIDHQHGGPTEPCNLAHVCRRHHTLKHQTPWRVEQRPGGVLAWTSPLGRIYLDQPPSVLRFVSAPVRQ